jgi:hypothetical protein
LQQALLHCGITTPLSLPYTLSQMTELCLDTTPPEMQQIILEGFTARMPITHHGLSRHLRQ